MDRRFQVARNLIESPLQSGCLMVTPVINRTCEPETVDPVDWCRCYSRYDQMVTESESSSTFTTSPTGLIPESEAVMARLVIIILSIW